MSEIVRIKNLVQAYKLPNGQQTLALKDISLSISAGEFISVMGPSGSGKSSLSNIIGLLQSVTQGEYYLCNQPVHQMNSEQRGAARSQMVGFIFQDYSLLDHLNVIENVILPLTYSGLTREAKMAAGLELLKQLGVESKALTMPRTLSGGQKQRVAIARALVTNPNLLIADEPTGALDPNSKQEVLGLLQDINERGTTILMVTHSESDISASNRVITIEQGELVNDVSIWRRRRFFISERKNQTHHFLDFKTKMNLVTPFTYWPEFAKIEDSILQLEAANATPLKWFESPGFVFGISTHWNSMCPAAKAIFIASYLASGSKIGFDPGAIEAKLGEIESLNAVTVLAERLFAYQSLHHLELRELRFFALNKNPKVRSLYLNAVKQNQVPFQFEGELNQDQDSRVRADLFECKVKLGLIDSKNLSLTNIDKCSDREFSLIIYLLSQNGESEELLSLAKNEIETKNWNRIKSLFFGLAKLKPETILLLLQRLASTRPEYSNQFHEINLILERSKKFNSSLNQNEERKNVAI